MKKLITLMLSLVWMISSAQTFNWTAQTSGVTAYLRDVFFVDNQTGWAVGDDGVILRTSDGGTTWVTQTSGTTHDMRAVFFLDANTGWAVGYANNNVTLKTTDGGSTWTDISTVIAGTGILRDIAFSNANDGWMVASDAIYASTDGGTTWTAQTTNSSVTAQGYTALAVPTDSTAYVGGRSKRTTSSYTYADVFAKTLSPSAATDFLSSGQSNFKTTDMRINSMAFATPTILFAGGTEGTIYKLDGFQGSTNIGPWDVNLDLNPSTTQSIASISFPTASNGMFLTAAPTSAINTVIYHTSDTGNTWNMMPDTIPGLIHGALHAPDANTAWVVGLNGAIYRGQRSTIGITETVIQNISVYPNPVKDVLWISGELETASSIEVLDLSGRVISKCNTGSDKIDVSSLKSGSYLLKIQVENGVSINKFMKL